MLVMMHKLLQCNVMKSVYLDFRGMRKAWISKIYQNNGRGKGERGEGGEKGERERGKRGERERADNSHVWKIWLTWRFWAEILPRAAALSPTCVAHSAPPAPTVFENQPSTSQPTSELHLLVAIDDFAINIFLLLYPVGTQNRPYRVIT